MKRIGIAALVAGVVALFWAFGRSSGAIVTAADSLAPSCRVALAEGPQASEPDRRIDRAKEDARNGARGQQALERLGYLYVSRARVRNDPGDYTLAEAAAECLESRQPGDLQALLLRGHVLHQRHRFAEAEQLARVLVARRNYVLDHGLLGDTLLEQGRLEEAAAAYQRMIDLKPFYQSYVRAAHLRWLTGNVAGAMEMMRLAIDSASPRDPESAAWAWTRLSAYQLQAGRLDDATASADAALIRQPDYSAALLAKGRVLLARKRTAEAIELLRRAARLNPLPEYQWYLADSLRLGALDAEADVVERDLTTRGTASDPRTAALYLATRRTDPAKALALVEEELRNRQDVFTLDAHAWTLLANGRIAEADERITAALAAGTSDARLFLHAGLVRAAAGRSAEAKRWFSKARELRATLLPSENALLANHPAAN